MFPSFVPETSNCAMTRAWASSGRPRRSAAASCFWRLSRPSRWAQTARAKPKRRPRTLPSFVPRGSNSAMMVSRTSCGSDARKWAPASSRPMAMAYSWTPIAGSGVGAHGGEPCCAPKAPGAAIAGSGAQTPCEAVSRPGGQPCTTGRSVPGWSMDRAKACRRPRTFPSLVPRGLKLRRTLARTSSGRDRRKSPASGPRLRPCTKPSMASSSTAPVMAPAGEASQGRGLAGPERHRP
mmetsp:Transcript_112732/g.313669  ORF Transcript_112732/g.313669 Transcript_112732/m.313669 type:complete len:237 (-) Transcript_112732:7-717(-)